MDDAKMEQPTKNLVFSPKPLWSMTVSSSPIPFGETGRHQKQSAPAVLGESRPGTIPRHHEFAVAATQGLINLVHLSDWEASHTGWVCTATEVALYD